MRHFSLCLLYLLFIAVPCATAQRPFRGGRGIWGAVRNDSLLTLAAIDEVRKEVRLRKEQNELVDALLVDVRAQFRKSFEGVNPFRNGVDEARGKIKEISGRFDVLLTVVLEPEQLERLQQLQLQREGLRALDRTDFQKQLSLEETQLEEIQKLLKAGRKRIQDAGEDRKAAQKHRAQLETDVLELLNDKQKEKWIAMKGKTYRFPEREGRSTNRDQPDEPDGDEEP